MDRWHPFFGSEKKTSKKWIALRVWVSIYIAIYLSIHPFIYLSIHLSIYSYLSISSVYLAVYLAIYPSTYLSIYLSVRLSVCLSIYLPVYLPAWKPSYSARLPHFSKLTTSKTQHFCETFPFFWTEQHPKWSNSARFLQFLNLTTKQMISARLPSKMESWVQSWQPRTNAFCDFSTPPV